MRYTYLWQKSELMKQSQHTCFNCSTFYYKVQPYGLRLICEFSQQKFTCSESKIGTLAKGMKYVQRKQ